MFSGASDSAADIMHGAFIARRLAARCHDKAACVVEAARLEARSWIVGSSSDSAVDPLHMPAVGDAAVSSARAPAAVRRLSYRAPAPSMDPIRLDHRSSVKSLDIIASTSTRCCTRSRVDACRGDGGSCAGRACAHSHQQYRTRTRVPQRASCSIESARSPCCARRLLNAEARIRSSKRCACACMPQQRLAHHRQRARSEVRHRAANARGGGVGGGVQGVRACCLGSDRGARARMLKQRLAQHRQREYYVLRAEGCQCVRPRRGRGVGRARRAVPAASAAHARVLRQRLAPHRQCVRPVLRAQGCQCARRVRAVAAARVGRALARRSSAWCVINSAHGRSCAQRRVDACRGGEDCWARGHAVA